MRFLTDLTLRRAIGGIMALATGFTLVAALLMRIVEPKTYKNYGEAVWWAVQTVSTVGYGDNVPVTGGGRIVATVVMIFGIALIPATTSLVVAVFMNQQLHRFAEQEARGSADDL
jgi:voltage-gated potassium channel